MDLLPGDGQLPTPDDFPQQIAPFPANGSFLVTNPTAASLSPDIDGLILPPQKLRPIRGNGGRSPSTLQPNYLTSLQPGADAGGLLDGSLENLGLLGDEACRVSGCFELAGEAETCMAFLNGGGGGCGGEGDSGGPKSKNGLIDGETSSPSDDDDDDDDSANSSVDVLKETMSKKRKRKKIENFLESLATRVMEKQEQMHQQLIEMIERKEKERITREEAWRQQKIDRIKKEEELRAQENSRSLALISLIQTLSDHKIAVPLPSMSVLPVSPMEINVDKDNGNIPIHNGCESTLTDRRWPEAEVKALITLQAACEQNSLVTGSKSSDIWDEIAAKMHSIGYHRSAKKCREKWDNMNKYSRKSMEIRGNEQHENSKRCPCIQELNMFYKNGLINLANASNHIANEN